LALVKTRRPLRFNTKLFSVGIPFRLDLDWVTADLAIANDVLGFAIVQKQGDPELLKTIGALNFVNHYAVLPQKSARRLGTLSMN